MENQKSIERKLVLEYGEGNLERDVGSYVVRGEGDWKDLKVNTTGFFREYSLSGNDFLFRSNILINSGFYLIYGGTSEHNLGGLLSEGVRADKSEAHDIAYACARDKLMNASIHFKCAVEDRVEVSDNVKSSLEKAKV
jgi:hypothetical protein